MSTDPRSLTKLGGVESGSPPILSIPASGLSSLSEAEARALAQRESKEGDELCAKGQFREGLSRYLHSVQLVPDSAQYRYSVAFAAQEVGDLALVEPHLLEAIRIDPSCVPAYSALGLHYCNAGKLDLALQHSAKAISLDDRFPPFLTARAFVLLAAGDTDGARKVIEPLLSAGSTLPQLIYVYAKLATKLKQEEKLLELTRRALSARDTPAAEKPHIHLVAATMLDRLGRWDEAFEQARLGKKLLRALRRRFEPAAHSRSISSKIDYLTSNRLSALPRANHSNRRPLFIVGMPRSGTSLVEQILASHPAVFGAGELTTLQKLAQNFPKGDWAENTPYPDCYEWLSPREANRQASKYLLDIEALNKEATYVTDKMPENYLHLDLVELLLPECRVIHCVRGALDTCVSCYLTDFAGGNEFSFDLGHLASYYKDYRRLMEHWKKVLKVPMLDVRYEDIVLDTRGSTQRMLEFLELPWDDRCLKYYENKRRINTASEDQVRQPIYTSSIGRWKHYEKHLEELFNAMAQ